MHVTSSTCILASTSVGVGSIIRLRVDNLLILILLQCNRMN